MGGEALSNEQIVSRLSLKEATVKRHLRNVFVKLGAVSRIDAVNKATEEEKDRVAALTEAVSAVRWDRILFCAKAWFPLTRRWLGFEEARIDFDPGARSFTAELLVDGPVLNGRPLTGFTGRWLISRELIVTSIVIPNTQPTL